MAGSEWPKGFFLVQQNESSTPEVVGSLDLGSDVLMLLSERGCAVHTPDTFEQACERIAAGHQDVPEHFVYAMLFEDIIQRPKLMELVHAIVSVVGVYDDPEQQLEKVKQARAILSACGFYNKNKQEN